MSGLRDLRNNQNTPQEHHPVVKVESILGQPEVTPTLPEEQPSPGEQQQVTTTEEFDLNALLQYFPDDEQEGEESEKLTFYLKPYQHEKLLLICETYSTRGTLTRKVPENYQHVLRYILDTFPLDAFAGMPKYVREKKMERLKALGQRQVQKLMRNLKMKSRRITGE